MNIIQTIILNNDKVELEFYTLKKIHDVIKSISSHKYNSITRRWQISATDLDELTNKLQNLASVELPIEKPLVSTKHVTISHDGEFAIIKFSPYCEDIKTLIKASPGAKYESNTKSWRILQQNAKVLINQLKYLPNVIIN